MDWLDSDHVGNPTETFQEYMLCYLYVVRAEDL
jgi:hypothetical protein